jgi:phosphopantothenoylcysteine decarboxylase/phosphopantothenate--cysteine ligase
MRAVARVIVGVTGGIAAYKACELVRLLVNDGHEVIPLLTPGAERFVTTETFDALARRKDDGDPYPHLRRAEVLVVAPLSANTLAKLAHGLADNVLTEAALAHDGPLLVAPAMNARMWAHPATQANVAILRERAVEVIGPEEGELAEGEQGLGRMTEPEAILSRVRELLGPGTLAGRRFLVSAGGTREPLDSVRFVGNRSSGRMGVALAAEARRRGADVTLLAANLSVPPPAGVAVVDTPTAADMFREAAARADADAVLMAAAVADYRPAGARAQKRSKDEHAWNVELVPTDDVLAALGARRRNGQVLVAFGADHGNAGLQRKRAMLDSK